MIFYALINIVVRSWGKIRFNPYPSLLRPRLVTSFNLFHCDWIRELDLIIFYFILILFLCFSDILVKNIQNKK